MPKQLPSRPSLEHLSKESKALLKSWRKADPKQVARFKILNRFSKRPPQRIFEYAMRLADAQSVIAMEYGFKSWKELRQHIVQKRAPKVRNVAVNVVLGQACLTDREIEMLKRGDIVHADRNAGEHHFVLFDGKPEYQGDIVVMGEVMGLRIVRSVAAAQKAQDFDEVPKGKQRLIVSMGRVDFSPKEIEKVGVGTVISLDRRISRPEGSPRLLLGNKAIAVGEIVVTNQTLGIRLTRVYGKRGTSASMEGASASNTFLYDFRKPDRISIQAMRAIQNLSETFITSMASQLPEYKAFVLQSVDQLFFSEVMMLFDRKQDKGLPSVLLFEARTDSRSIEGHIPPEQAFYVAPDNPRCIVDSKSIETYMRQQFLMVSSGLKPVLVTAERCNLLRMHLQGESNRELLRTCLNAAWADTMPLNLGAHTMGSSLSGQGEIAPGEMVISCTFGDPSNRDEFFLTVYSERTLLGLHDLFG